MDSVSRIHDLTSFSVAQIHQMGRQDNYCRHCKSCKDLGPGESICMAKCWLDGLCCMWFWKWCIFGSKALTRCDDLYFHSDSLVSAGPFGVAPVSSTILCFDFTPLYYGVSYFVQGEGTVFSDPLHLTVFVIKGNTVKFEWGSCHHFDGR